MNDGAHNGDPVKHQPGMILLRDVCVHNLKGINLDIPHRKLTVICGLSGSGKSSLALDTLYAEGQRRYIESFSAYTRQFLDQLEKPDAELIDGIPPAIAVTGNICARSSRSTVGTATEVHDFLRLLFARLGTTFCVSCGHEVRRDTPKNVAELLETLPLRTHYMVAWKLDFSEKKGKSISDVLHSLLEDGFIRVIIDGHTWNLAEHFPLPEEIGSGTIYVLGDRLSVGMPLNRVRESLEIAFMNGHGRCCVLINTGLEDMPYADNFTAANQGRPVKAWESLEIDSQLWTLRNFSTRLSCEDCQIDYPVPEPRLFSFNSPLGACPVCEGFGNTMNLDMNLIIPDHNKTLSDGAVAAWNSPAYRHELVKLQKYGPKYGLPCDVPYKNLTSQQKELLLHGIPDTEFSGLIDFFAGLERRKYKMHVRVFLSRWRSYKPCEACGGQRLQPLALATLIGGKNIAELCEMKIEDLLCFFNTLELTEWQEKVGKTILTQIKNRLKFLINVSLGYLTLDRTLRTLSSGESRRVSLAASLGASLVNMLYVLDEPSIGLHPRDTQRLLDAILALRNRDNTVVVVEHEESIIRAADRIIEIGPGAGEHGGEIVFAGTPQEMLADRNSLTGAYLSGERGHASMKRRPTENGFITLVGATGNNLKNVTIKFPLGVLCLVTGVSGSGKSTLVENTLYPALCRRFSKDNIAAYDYQEVLGDGQIDEVIMVDQTPIGRSPRSNPVTYLKVFDEIRAVFADTREAKRRGYSAGHFSFNAEEGRCPACNGDGCTQVDMQFLADVYMRCGHCHGTRYRKEILDILYRNRNIAEVLEMTVREAFTFFRGSKKVQDRLKRLLEVGLDYIRLGQPANTLSGGEAQRLKLATYMSGAKRGRCLFILDEPTTGLHFSDVVQLQDCFDSLLAVGHSLIVVEHNLQMMKAADYIIDLGPGAAEQGGWVVAAGTPEEICACQESVTGQFLKTELEKEKNLGA